jgi:hypothetical protein
MKTLLLIFWAVLVPKIIAQTNEPIVQVKEYRAPNLTNRVTLGERESPREISGEVWYAFGKRFMFYIQCESKPDIDGKAIIVQGYPGSEMITKGQKLVFTAQKIGVIHGVNNDGTEQAGEVRELWEWYDIEKASREDQARSDAIRIQLERAQLAQAIEEQKKTAAKKREMAAHVLKLNQDAAAKGIALDCCGWASVTAMATVLKKIWQKPRIICNALLMPAVRQRQKS